MLVAFLVEEEVGHSWVVKEVEELLKGNCLVVEQVVVEVVVNCLELEEVEASCPSNLLEVVVEQVAYQEAS